MKGALEQRAQVNHESIYSRHLPIAQSKDISYTDLVLNSMVTPARGFPPTQGLNIFPSVYPLLPTLLSRIYKSNIFITFLICGLTSAYTPVR